LWRVGDSFCHSESAGGECRGRGFQNSAYVVKMKRVP
jgi:hypothetical protein